MKLNRWIAAGAAAGAVLLPAVALAAPPDATNTDSFADSSEDAVSSVDILNVAVYRAANGDYRATMKFADLRTQNGNRYYVAFSDTGSRGGRQTSNRPSGLPSTPDGNLVEFRRTPGGQEKTLSFKTFGGGHNATPTTCSGVRAVPDYPRSKISFVIPASCWKGTSGAARVSAGARHYAPDTFSTVDNPPDTGGSDMKSDLLDESGTWVWAGIA